jgi:hypothetical protein
MHTHRGVAGVGPAVKPRTVLGGGRKKSFDDFNYSTARMAWHPVGGRSIRLTNDDGLVDRVIAVAWDRYYH